MSIYSTEHSLICFDNIGTSIIIQCITNKCCSVNKTYHPIIPALVHPQCQTLLNFDMCTHLLGEMTGAAKLGTTRHK